LIQISSSAPCSQTSSVGNTTVEHHNDWYDEECQISIEKKKVYTIMQQRSYTRASMEDYHAVGRNKKR
jgi:hypothetical protein